MIHHHHRHHEGAQATDAIPQRWGLTLFEGVFVRRKPPAQGDHVGRAKRSLVMTAVRNNRGQTLVEYLLLLSAAFISGYVIVTGPLSTFTTNMIANIKGTIQNVVRTGELDSSGQVPGQSGHPTSRTRLKPLHL